MCRPSDLNPHVVFSDEQSSKNPSKNQSLSRLVMLVIVTKKSRSGDV
jgi:hypothetical protein